MEFINRFQNFYQNKTVLVTGHTGFKGAWLCLWLNQLGAKVIGVSNEIPTNPSLFEAIALGQELIDERVDIRHFKALNQVFQNHKPEIVFHLAAQPLVRESYSIPLETFETNVMGTANVLEACKQTSSVSNIIVISSDKCYDNKEWVYGYRETDAMGGFDPYSASKGCTELVVASYRDSFFKNSTQKLASARAGNVIGGGDWAKDRLIPDCISGLINNKPIVLRNPHATRPWQHVLTPLSGYLLLGSLLQAQSNIDDGWNFGPSNTQPITVEAMVRELIKSWGSGSYRIEADTRLHEAHNLHLDISKASTYLQWNPLYSAEKAIQKTAEWYAYWNQKPKPEDLKRFTKNQIIDFCTP